MCCSLCCLLGLDVIWFINNVGLVGSYGFIVCFGRLCLSCGCCALCLLLLYGCGLDYSDSVYFADFIRLVCGCWFISMLMFVVGLLVLLVVVLLFVVWFNCLLWFVIVVCGEKCLVCYT